MQIRMVRNLAFVTLMAAAVLSGHVTGARAAAASDSGHWTDCIYDEIFEDAYRYYPGCYSTAVASLGCVGEADDCDDAADFCDDVCGGIGEVFQDVEFFTCVQPVGETPAVFICRCAACSECWMWGIPFSMCPPLPPT
jgi:hypothetical protein